MISGLISLLIAILVLGVVFYVIKQCLAIIGAPAFVLQIAQLIFLLIGLLYVLQLFGVVQGGLPTVRL